MLKPFVSLDLVKLIEALRISCLILGFTWGVHADILPGPADFTILSAGHQYLEGPSWSDTDQILVFTDQSANELWRWSGAGASLMRDYDGKINGTVFDSEGRLLLCESAARRINRITIDGDSLSDDILVNELPNEPNDIILHSNGSIWFTTPHFGGNSTDLSQQNVYRFDPQTSALSKIYSTSGKPNGLAFSPDESVLYVALYSSSQIMQIPLDTDGVPTGAASELTRDLASNPDGLKVDASGNLYVVATRGDDLGIVVFDPSGERLGLIRLPESSAPPTNLFFAGPYLYVTDGTLLVRSDWTGFPAAPQATIWHANSQVVIDGELDSIWGFVDPLPLRHPMIIWNMLDADDFIPAPDDLSAEAKVLWDADYLYVFATITDDTPLPPYTGTWFVEDTVEIYLDADRASASAGGSYDGLNDWEMGFHALAEGSIPITFGPNSVADATGFLAASQVSELGYTLELALPWETLGLSDSPADQHLIGLDLHVVDNDGHPSEKREHKLAWFGSEDNAWQDTTLFADVLLEEVTAITHYTGLTGVWAEPLGDESGGVWIHGRRFGNDWTWIFPPWFPWVYNIEAGWLYLLPINDQLLWAWNAAGDGGWIDLE